MKRNIVLVISIVIFVLAAVVTRVYLSAVNDDMEAFKRQLRGRYGEMDVLCFKNEVPSGTKLSKADLGLITVPERGMRGQALTPDNVTDAVGRKVLRGHRPGEVLFWSDLEGGNPTAVGLSADIKKTMRAVSINCSGAAAVSGMVKPNDHVDVIGTFDFSETSGKKTIVTCTMLQNVLVLATGNLTAKMRASAAPAGYSTVTLEVTPREAEMLAFAEQMKGRLMLSLRNRNDLSFEKELPKVDFEKIRSEIEELNNLRQLQKMTSR